MRVLTAAFRFAAAAAAATAVCSPVSTAVAAPASSLAGSWEGPFLSTKFTFEFTQAGDGWTGRYRSDKFGKWTNLHDVSFTDGVLRFSFKSQPPSKFMFKVDPSGKALNGSAQFGPHPALPLTLTRTS